MAKLSAPLLSLRASKSIGKAIVFFTWKGINVARQYVVPANPKSTDQLTQRGILDDAVAEWHASYFSADDKTAWNRYAGTLAKTMSGFNAMVKNFIDQKILGNAWARIHYGGCDTITTTTARFTVTATAGGDAPTVHYGVSKTNLSGSQAMVADVGNSFEGPVAGLAKDTLYYYSFDMGVSPTDYARLGIYQMRTLAA